MTVSDPLFLPEIEVISTSPYLKYVPEVILVNGEVRLHNIVDFSTLTEIYVVNYRWLFKTLDLHVNEGMSNIYFIRSQCTMDLKMRVEIDILDFPANGFTFPFDSAYDVSVVKKRRKSNHEDFLIRGLRAMVSNDFINRMFSRCAFRLNLADLFQEHLKQFGYLALHKDRKNLSFDMNASPADVGWLFSQPSILLVNLSVDKGLVQDVLTMEPNQGFLSYFRRRVSWVLNVPAVSLLSSILGTNFYWHAALPRSLPKHGVKFRDYPVKYINPFNSGIVFRYCTFRSQLSVRAPVETCIGDEFDNMLSLTADDFAFIQHWFSIISSNTYQCVDPDFFFREYKAILMERNNDALKSPPCSEG